METVFKVIVTQYCDILASLYNKLTTVITDCTTGQCISKYKNQNLSVFKHVNLNKHIFCTTSSQLYVPFTHPSPST